MPLCVFVCPLRYQRCPRQRVGTNLRHLQKKAMQMPWMWHWPGRACERVSKLSAIFVKKKPNQTSTPHPQWPNIWKINSKWSIKDTIMHEKEEHHPSRFTNIPCSPSTIIHSCFHYYPLLGFNHILFMFSLLSFGCVQPSPFLLSPLSPDCFQPFSLLVFSIIPWLFSPIIPSCFHHYPLIVFNHSPFLFSPLSPGCFHPFSLHVFIIIPWLFSAILPSCFLR